MRSPCAAAASASSTGACLPGGMLRGARGRPLALATVCRTRSAPPTRAREVNAVAGGVLASDHCNAIDELMPCLDLVAHVQFTVERGKQWRQVQHHRDRPTSAAKAPSMTNLQNSRTSERRGSRDPCAKSAYATRPTGVTWSVVALPVATSKTGCWPKRRWISPPRVEMLRRLGTRFANHSIGRLLQTDAARRRRLFRYRQEAKMGSAVAGPWSTPWQN